MSIKKYFPILITAGVLLGATSALAVAPQISQVKFKTAGDSNKIAVYFDQSVQSTNATSTPLGLGDFILGGSVGGSASIVAVSANQPGTIAVLTVSAPVNPASPGQWLVAASSTVRNSQSEPVAGGPSDLYGPGDSTAPSVAGVFLHALSALDVMYSEAVDSVSASSAANYPNLQTSAPGDTPGIQNVNLVPEWTFGILQTTASTTLDWGAGNTVDIGGVQDLVGNTLATTTVTILPAVKISEVKAAGTANTQDEFVELYNFSDLALNTGNLYLHIRTGGTDTAKTLTRMRSSLPDKGYYLIGSNSSYSGSGSLDASYDSAANDLTADSGVYISATSTADQLVIDLLGMGASPIREATGTLALAAGKSYERKAQLTSTTSTMPSGGTDEFKGNSSDTNNNYIDFVLRNSPEPQNSLSPKEFPFGGPGADDTQAPTVQGTFPSGMPGEMVPTNLQYVGFNFSEPMQFGTITTSTVQLYPGSATTTNLCASVAYANTFGPQSGPPGRCNISGALSAGVTYTFKISGDSLNATSSTAVRDMAGNALNQPSPSHGDASGNYVLTFTPASAGGGYTLLTPPVFVMGTMPFPGSFNIPSNLQKIFIKFSGNVATSTVTTSTVRVIKVSDGSAVAMSSVLTSASDSSFTSDMAVLTLSGALTANTEYRILVNGVQDTSSRTVQNFEAPFTTGAVDVTGPSVTGKLPSITSGVPVNAIDIHVMTDDRLDPSSISGSTVKVKQGTNESAGTVSFDPFTGEIIFLGQNVFLPSTSYTVEVNATGTVPCVKNLVNLCLQDTDGVTDGVYSFSFTTGAADGTGPRVMFGNADQRNLSVSFDEPVVALEAQTLDNYSLLVGGVTTTLSTMAGQNVSYQPQNRTAVIGNLNLPMSSTFLVTVNNLHDLSGNLIGSPNSAQGTILDMNKTGGFVGPGGPAGGQMPSGGGMGAPPQNFSTSTYAFVPEAMVRPFSPMAGVSSMYAVEVPISSQIKAAGGGGKIVLTFPTGFDVSSAVQDTLGPMVNDVNGPGAGTIGVAGVVADAGARTITVTLTQNTRCDAGNSTPCSGDAHDFLHIDIRDITNSALPKDASSGGYTVDIKTMDGTTVLESFTSKAFYLSAGGSSALVVNLTASGASSGTATVRLFSPMAGPREANSTTFTGGAAAATFTGLVSGDYGVSTDPLVTLGGTDYSGQPMPTPVRISGTTTTLNLALTTTGSLTSVTVSLTGPAGKNVDVFAGGAGQFTVKSTTTTGLAQTIVLKLGNGSWQVGAGPAMPRGAFSGPPPAPDYVVQPPVSVVVSGSTVKENSGTPDDGTVVITLSAAGKTLSGTVVDAQSRAMVGAEVFAYSPMGGYGTHGTTNSSGAFSLPVAAGVFQVGAFTNGLPPAGELAVEVKSDGSLVVNGTATSSVTLKLLKPDRTISGKVLDQSNNPAQGAGVFAYCDPGTSSNPCFGPGDHTGSPTNSDGSYTLYVKPGTWKVGAFLPGFGELPQLTKTVTSTDLTSINFSPSASTTFRNISGTVCRDDDASGNTTTCGSGDTKVNNVFVRAWGSAGANQTATAQDGTYILKVPAGSGYTLEAFDPSLGRLASLTGVDATSADQTGQDFVVGNPRTVTVNVKDSGGNAVQVNQLMVDFYDFTTKTGNNLQIKNATSGTISLPAGAYKVRASLPGKGLSDSAIDSDHASTTVATTTATLTVDGSEVIKVTLPSLGTVAGTVYHSSATSGNELADAFVQFANPAAGIFLGAQASSAGAFSLKLPLGTYNAIAQKPGYVTSPIQVTIASSTATTTQNLVAQAAAATISGTVNVAGSAAGRAFVKAEKLGGGFAGSQTDSAGAYSLSVSNGTWNLFAVAEGYAETAYASNPVVISGSPATANFNLTSTVTLNAPKVCQITPAQGGECSDPTNGVRVVVPPAALGSGTTAGTLTIKQTNAMVQTSGTKPLGTSFDFEFVDSSGSKVSNFNSALTLEFTQSTTTLAASGITTKTQADGMKVILWSETLKDYDVLTTTVDYLGASDALISAPAEDLSNVTSIRLKALTTHFSGGGPGGGDDSLAPAAPTGVTATGASSNIGVSWSAVTTNSDTTSLSDLSDYRVWRSTSSSANFAVLGTVASTTVNYTDSSAAVNTTYYYRVTARDTSSNESAQSSSSSGAARTTSGFISAPSGGGGSTPTVVATTTTATTTTATATTTVATSTPATVTTTTSTVSVAPPVAAPGAGIVARGITPAASIQALPGFQGFAVRLVRGLRSKDVKQLQLILAGDKSVYPEGDATGYFGPATARAVQRFQEKYGIAKQGDPGYGEVGPGTRAKLNQLLSSGSSGTAALTQAELRAKIQMLQAQLIQLLEMLAAKIKR
ncbi:MAG: Ig-like domain-containing protein [Candidatus Liptonbacteria bacterium]|nr:Ig-like domain-containing protein [Candidatus Liptonbacteria bacterium]